MQNQAMEKKDKERKLDLEFEKRLKSIDLDEDTPAVEAKFGKQLSK